MYPKLLHIYGPFFLQSYGVCIALGVTLFAWLLYRDPYRRAHVSEEQFHSIFLVSIISAIVGGRILYCLIENPITNFYEFFEFWHGGFAVLGSLLGVLLVLPWYLKKCNLPVLPILDRVALYAPLLQAISRVGCFLSGCCYGSTALVPWAITYLNPECRAPLGVALHPTQLYSALSLLSIFILLYSLKSRMLKKGQLALLYLILMSFERFIIDFFRDDRVFFASKTSLLSLHQYVALLIISCSVLFWVRNSQKTFTIQPL